ERGVAESDSLAIISLDSALIIDLRHGIAVYLDEVILRNAAELICIALYLDGLGLRTGPYREGGVGLVIFLGLAEECDNVAVGIIRRCTRDIAAQYDRSQLNI